MGRKRKIKPCRPVAVFDSETVNVPDLKRSLPVTYQLGVCYSPIEEVRQEDIKISVYRHEQELYNAFDNIIIESKQRGFTPVVMVHNLAYDLHFVMPYIIAKDEAGYEINACFKSSVKPLSIKICPKGSNEAVLIFWDTLSFSGKSLAKMGDECGHKKAVGMWDYSLVRTAETTLSSDEYVYATEDVCVPFMWLKYWAKLNPDVDTAYLGNTILTKTSVVRHKCKCRTLKETYTNSKGKNLNVYKAYTRTCLQELPKDEQSYNLMIKSTSAGWTFTSSGAAGKTYRNVRKYDATSMHPSHMVSHFYPYGFDTTIRNEYAQILFQETIDTPLSELLENWGKPFEYAFNAKVRFTNLRPKTNSLFERDGVMLHGKALFKDYEIDENSEDDELQAMEVNAINAAGYRNIAVNPVYEFGKLVSADSVTIHLNELNSWVHGQVYEWDSFEVLEMSSTGKMKRTPDYVPISVGMMLDHKKTFKQMMHKKLPETRPEWVPEVIWEEFEQERYSSELVKSFYTQTKAELNSLYGVLATNEYKQSMVFEGGTFVHDGIRGFDKEVKTPKAWYNMGMRIAAWSRVQQCIAMILCDKAGFVETYINGDTDSFAFEAAPGVNDTMILEVLEPLHESIRRSITWAVNRCLQVSPTLFDGLGEYEEDCQPSEYCAVANKRYAYKDKDLHIHIASAGVPNNSIKLAVEYEMNTGSNFSQSIIRALGYNCVYIESLSGAKYKSQPQYGAALLESYPIQDYRGNTYEYPTGTPLGIYLEETDKALGLGYEEDYKRCCLNASVNMERLRNYELAGDQIRKW